MTTACYCHQVHSADVNNNTHFPLIAGVLLGGLDEVAPTVKELVVLLLRHVSILHEHMWQMRLWSGDVNTRVVMKQEPEINTRWTRRGGEVIPRVELSYLQRCVITAGFLENITSDD